MITTDKVNQIFCIIYDFSKNLAELSYMDLDFAAKIVQILDSKSSFYTVFASFLSRRKRRYSQKISVCLLHFRVIFFLAENTDISRKYFRVFPFFNF